MQIEIKDIEHSYTAKGYTQNIFKNFSLKINQGDFVMILGPSGCGKSTLLNIIGGLMPPCKGKISFDGISYYSLTKRKQDIFRGQHISFVFQSFYLIEDMSPVDNVLIAMSYIKKTKNEKMKIAKEKIAAVGLKDKIKSKIKNLSGGEQQRLAIARALAQEGKVIICDEPTGNLDEQSALEIMKILKGLSRKGVTVIMVTHNTGLNNFADKVIELSKSVRIGEDLN